MGRPLDRLYPWPPQHLRQASIPLEAMVVPSACRPPRILPAGASLTVRGGGRCLWEAQCPCMYSGWCTACLQAQVLNKAGSPGRSGHWHVFRASHAQLPASAGAEVELVCLEGICSCEALGLAYLEP